MIGLAGAELGVVRRARAVDFLIFGRVVHVAHRQEQPKGAAQIVFAAHVDEETFLVVAVGAGLNVGAGDWVGAFLSAVIFADAEIPFCAGHAEAPTGAERTHVLQLVRVLGALRGGVGKKLCAPRPGRQKGERLPVVEFETRHAHVGGIVDLGGDGILAVGLLVQSVGREELGRDRAGDIGEEVREVADEETGCYLAGRAEVIFEPRDVAAGLPCLN